MTVLVVSEGTPDYDSVLCVICLQKVPLTDVTAGSLYANGRQAFACNTHLHDRTRWITEWSLFDTRQQEQQPTPNVEDIW
jgi:hypothetical protein